MAEDRAGSESLEEDFRAALRDFNEKRDRSICRGPRFRFLESSVTRLLRNEANRGPPRVQVAYR